MRYRWFSVDSVKYRASGSQSLADKSRELSFRHAPHVTLPIITLCRESPLQQPNNRSHRKQPFAVPPNYRNLRFLALTKRHSSRLRHGSVLRASRRAVVRARHCGSLPLPMVSSLRLRSRVVGTLTDISGPHRGYLSYAGLTCCVLVDIG